MTLTIELTPEQEACLAKVAWKEGAEPTVLVSQWIAEHLPHAKAYAADAENQAVIDLLRSWQEEDATEDEKELERRDKETQELLYNLQTNRLTLRTWEA